MQKINKMKCHSVLDTGSSTLAVSQRPQQALKMPNQVQHDGSFYTNGFTLIELLVVVLIIGILAAVAVPQYTLAVDKARLSNLMSIMQTLKNAQEIYYAANGTYATNWDELDIEKPTDAAYQFSFHPLGLWGAYTGLTQVRLLLGYQQVGEDTAKNGICYAKTTNSRADTLCRQVTHTKNQSSWIADTVMGAAYTYSFR